MRPVLPGRGAEIDIMVWEMRHLAGDDIVSIRIVGEVDAGKLDALADAALALAARNGALKFMVDHRQSVLTPAECREHLLTPLARALMPSRAHRLALIVGGAGEARDFHADDAPDFDARQQIFSRPSCALYWLAGRKPRPYSGRALVPG